MKDLPEKLTKPAQRALASADIDSLEKLTTFTEQEVADLHDLHGIGQNALKQLKEAMKEKGLDFKYKH